MNKYFKVIANTDYLSSWKSKGLSAETIKSPTTSDNSLTPVLSYYGTKTRVKFTASCLQQPRVSYTHGTIVSIYTVYELGASSPHTDDPTLKTLYLVQSNADNDKYGYLSFSFPSGEFGQNAIIFRVDKSSSAHVDNKKKGILILG